MLEGAGGRSSGLYVPYGGEGMVRRQRRNDAITISKFWHIGRAISGPRKSPILVNAQSVENISINMSKNIGCIFPPRIIHSFGYGLCIWRIDVKTPHRGFPAYLGTGDVFIISELISP